MADAEEMAGDNAFLSSASDEAGDDKAKPILIWLPLAILGAALFTILGAHGFPVEQVSGPDFRAGLAAAYLLAAITLFLLLIRLGVKTVTESFTDYTRGMSGMMPIAATLVLAWTLGDLSETLGTGAYVAEIARDGVPGWFVPAVIFVLAAIISFATGSSWGTIVIMMPLAIPAAVATGADLSVTIGAVLSGGLFGDHSSPISETTILSSTGAGTTPLAHFQTQMPYALTNGAIAFGSFVAAGLTASASMVVAAFTVQFVVLLVIRYRFRSRQP